MPNKTGNKALPAKPDTRHACPFCGVRTWARDYVGFLRDHDKPEGGLCVEAKRQYTDPGKATALGYE